MSTFRGIVLIILAISFFVFVTFFGRIPALRHTPIATLHRLLWIRLPRALLALDRRLTAGRLSSSVSNFFHYLTHDRHPTIVIFFVVLLVGSEYLYLPYAWPQLGWFLKCSVIFTVFAPYLFLYLSCFSDPGFITAENHAYYMSLYPYDFAVFHPGNECKTCRFLKPARSKHCSICKRCIAKADHHCIFINLCVGYGNHHWFLSLLLSMSFLTIYGSLLGLSLMATDLKGRYPSWSIWPPKNMSFATYFTVWWLGMDRYPGFGAVTLLCSLITPLVVGLSIYTFYLVYCGTTTNESLKWSDWKEDISDGYAFGRPLPLEKARDSRIEPSWTRWPLNPMQVLIVASNGQQPKATEPLPGAGEWARIHALKDVENLYDMGFWDNLKDSFISDYAFGQPSSRHSLGRVRFRTRNATKVVHPP